jgi:hypothetical protein
MDKEFEEWYESKLGEHAEPAGSSMRNLLEIVWNASKQHWLDKCVEVVDDFRFNYKQTVKENSSGLAEAIKELK